MKYLRKIGTSFLILATAFLTYTPYIYVPMPGKPGQLKQVRTARIVHADTGGPSSAGTDAAATTACTDVQFAWSGTGSPGGTNADDTTYVQYTGNGWDSEDTDELRVSNFGFNTSGTIDGIQVDVIAWTPAGNGTYQDVILFTSPGTPVGDDKSAATALPTSDPGTTHQTFGSSSDNWNASLTAAQVNSANFGVSFCFLAAVNNATINVDHVQITVTYTPPASAPTVATNPITSYGTFFGDFSGTISATGGSDATETGFAWGTSALLTTGVSTTTLGAFTGTGDFSQRIGVLQPGTQYWVRAYATNVNGTGYGTIRNFTTHAEVPSRTLRLISGKLKINQGSRMIIRQR